MRACFKLNILLFCIGVGLTQGCSDRQEVKPKNVTKQWPAPAASSAHAVKKDIEALILEVEANASQSAAIRQSSEALKALALVPVGDAVELEYAVAEVLAGAACIKARFSGDKLRTVNEEVPQRALATNAVRLKADSAFESFKNNPNLGPLDLLKPEGTGCADELSAAPESDSESDEVYLDGKGNEVPSPKATTKPHLDTNKL